MNFTPPTPDLWEYLQSTDKTIVMYGMGNGADKILAVCERYGIVVSDFFASDGFVRGHRFHDKTVLSYSAVKEKYGAENLIVLLSFASSRPEVLKTIQRVSAECELYAPDVPVFGNTLFNMPFLEAHQSDLLSAYDLLADDESRRIFTHVVAYKITGDIAYLFSAENDKDDVYRELLHAEEIRSALDLGAYNGDTIRELQRYAPNLERVFAMEPDRRNYRKLCEFAEQVSDTLPIRAVQAAAWSEKTALQFGDEGNRNASLSATGNATRITEVEALPPDDFLAGAPVDYIKYDVEGAEAEAIMGTSKTILTHRPKLLISAYHRSEDLYSLPLLIHKLRPDYRLYLRRYPYIPAWDLNLICV